MLAALFVGPGMADAGAIKGKVVKVVSEKAVICSILKESPLSATKQEAKCEVQDEISDFALIEGKLDYKLKKNQKVIIQKDRKKVIGKVILILGKDAGLDEIALAIAGNNAKILFYARDGGYILLDSRKEVRFSMDEEVKIMVGKKRRVEGC